MWYVMVNDKILWHEYFQSYSECLHRCLELKEELIACRVDPVRVD